MGVSRCAIYLSETSESEAIAVASAIGVISEKPKFLRRASDQSDVQAGEIGIGSFGAWAVIFSESGPFLEGEHFINVARLCSGKTVFCWLTQSAAGGLWFEQHTKGQLVRKWIYVDGAVEFNEGAVLPEEIEGLFALDSDGGDEWEIVDLAGRVSGISSDELFNMPFSVYGQSARLQT
jgi:hypothetical protein